MDDPLAGDIEVGTNSDAFLARYTPSTHRLATPCAAPDPFWSGERRIHVSPANDPGSIELHARVREKVRDLLNEAKDDWASVSVFGIATYTVEPQPVLVIVLRPDDRRSLARVRQIVLEVIDLGIEIVEGDVAPRASGTDQQIDAMRCQKAAALTRDVFTQPQLGSSVGLALPEATGFGTLGF
ncbi:hypothetical protein B0I37DRAFT_414039 [Chaetomium sp. MPI-CAGE-AT-0009]|nr:hypothetical protein B0I37DRAFT_414039 [Chaetomium sp. MPI-CAGE-AT-0009]